MIIVGLVIIIISSSSAFAITNPAIFTNSGLTASRTYTVPDTSGQIDIVNATQTLINKGISGLSNTISNIQNSALDATIVQTNKTNIFSIKQDFGQGTTQVFPNNGIVIRNPASTFAYQLTGQAIAANRTLNIPILAGSDTLSTVGLSQTYTGTPKFSGGVDFSTATDKFGSGSIAIRNPAGTFATDIKGGAITSSNKTANLPVLTNDATFAFEPRYNFTSPSAKSSTASASAVMWGGFATLTTRYSNNATVYVSGYWNNNLAGDGCSASIATNPSFMGANGAAAAGTLVGSSFIMTSGTALENQTFSKQVVVTGLTAGTQQYYDLQFARTGGGNCHIYNVDWLIKEQ